MPAMNLRVKDAFIGGQQEPGRQYQPEVGQEE
jgi:hypothetical protein